ncbi:proline-rich receptor-like protein kinase PERK1 isoform X2 [Dioscorea cayenensis subsp. rotundata]|uniref:non-specific serine/threonine protein kinase n=1 Tax=Dioscorea cayennensis subsp. rotundata TaxID=55577 RepID=A0AB40BCE6_DIOCR|nr:proline-rich receptor-like protein kinase PERK1 isoform X2 [Dioscorea cayenensis subsp. rotundata]
MSSLVLALIIVGSVVLLILLFLYWNCRCRSEPTSTPRDRKVTMDVDQAPKTLKNDSSRSRLEVKTDSRQPLKEKKNDPSPSQKDKVKTDGGQALKEKKKNDPSPSQKDKVKTDGGQALKEKKNDPSPSKKDKVKTDGGQALEEKKNDPSPSQKDKVKTVGGQPLKEKKNDPSPSKKDKVKTDGGQALKAKKNDPSPSQKDKVKTDVGWALKEKNNDPSPSQKNKDKTNGGQAQDSQWNAPPRSDHGLQTGSSSSGPDNSLTCPRPGIAFTYEELKKATNSFSRANFLGEGGFGPVHKGVVTIDKKGVLPFHEERVLPFDKEIAVKQLKSGAQQGQSEFEAEVNIISHVHHKHLVSLIGHCISGERRLLAYEFVSNKTLQFHLHGEGQPAMEWSIRLKIALGSAKGLAYLHEDCHPTTIIHRDIKAANILLDSKFEAKVADFGLAKVVYDNNTHVSTRVMGTYGYLAPEYFSTGKLTDKADVYSFGVMLLELITGRRPIALVDWARPSLTHALEEGNYEPLVDPRLGKNYNPSEMNRMVACAAACVHISAENRPPMSRVVRVLEGDVPPEDLKVGVPSGRSWNSGDVENLKRMAFGPYS